MKRKIRLVFALFFIMFCLCACGGKTKEKSLSTAEQFFFGSSSSALDRLEQGAAFTMTNVTGQKIQSIQISNSWNGDTISLISKEMPFMPWEERNFFCPVIAKDELSEFSEQSDDLIQYSAEIKLENGTTFLLHDFPLGQSVKMMVVYEKNIGYLIYENLKNQKMISTLEKESLLSGQNLVDTGNVYGEIQDPFSDFYQNPYADYDQPPVYIDSDLPVDSSRETKDGCLDGGLFW